MHTGIVLFSKVTNSNKILNVLIKRLGNGKLPGKTVQFPFQF